MANLEKEDIKETINKIHDIQMKFGHKQLIKAFLGFEYGIEDNDILDYVYDNYLENDDIYLLSDDINDMIVSELLKKG